VGVRGAYRTKNRQTKPGPIIIIRQPERKGSHNSRSSNNSEYKQILIVLERLGKNKVKDKM
jgi:hypothetical protein